MTMSRLAQMEGNDIDAYIIHPAGLLQLVGGSSRSGAQQQSNGQLSVSVHLPRHWSLDLGTDSGMTSWSQSHLTEQWLRSSNTTSAWLHTIHRARARRYDGRKVSCIPSKGSIDGSLRLRPPAFPSFSLQTEGRRTPLFLFGGLFVRLHR